MPARLLRSDARFDGAAAGDNDHTDTVRIGLVNNMPDAAIRATERQFIALLDQASADIDVTLRLYSLPSIPRSPAARELFMPSYAAIDELYDAGDIDALIVTGTEPRSPDLAEEPYWRELTRLIDWAQANTVSAIWSCLAAHAAVLHLDGIERRPLGDKLSGVFECAKTLDHALVADVPSSWHVPHSRYNDLPRDALLAKSYEPLTSSPQAGVDSFIKDTNSLFLFFQGHLEYDSNSLLREYVRDITRYLDGERDDYPTMPRGYLDPAAERAFEAVRATALDVEATTDESAKHNARPGVAVAARIAERQLVNFWRSPAANIYGNWLTCVRQRKRARQGLHPGQFNSRHLCGP